MSSTSRLDAFAARLRGLISLSSRHGAPDTARCDGLELPPVSEGFDARDFEEFARELFELQFVRNVPYRRFCQGQGISPGTITHWSQIPAVPTAAFKDLEISSIPAEERTTEFHSSGTTGQRPSRHLHHAASLAVYEASLWAWFEEMVRSESAIPQLAILTPRPMQAPHSSLVHMFEVIRRRYGAGEDVFLGTMEGNGTWQLHVERVCERLESAAAGGRPLLVMGTAFLYVHLLDYLSARNKNLRLPAGSLVLETGGYKGRSRSLPKAELHELMAKKLGLTLSQIVCEYGMSELSSQAYDQVSKVGTGKTDNLPSARSLRFPPWARVQIVSPETGLAVSEGETGLIRVYDLANVYSVMALQTEDLGVRRGDGFELIGRAALSEPRGCSLMAV